MITGGILGSYVGSKLTFKINTTLLKRIFLLLIFSAYRMIFYNQVESITGDILYLFFVRFYQELVQDCRWWWNYQNSSLVLFGGFDQIVAQGIFNDCSDSINSDYQTEE